MLITKTDILEFWPMSVNMDDSRINPYIIRAEQNNLSSLLGPELFYALSTATIVPGDRFDKLLNGDVYNTNGYPRNFPGVKQLLTAYAFAYIVSNNPVHVTRGGVNRKAGDATESVTTRESETKSTEAYSEAIRLEGEFYEWISRTNAYPEYNTRGPAKETGINFFNASRGRTEYGFGPNYWVYKNPHN